MKKYARRSFNFLTILFIIFYFLSSLTPYINPIAFWPMTFLALAFPVLALLAIVFIISWLFLQRKVAVVLLLIFLAGYKNLGSTISLKNFLTFTYKKEAGNFRVLSWNVRNFDNCLRSAESSNGVRRQMINFLKHANADVLLLQEFVEYDDPAYYSNTLALDSIGYPYRYVTNDFVFYLDNVKIMYGSAIFSKIPLLNAGKILYDHLPVPESICYADINTANTTVKIITTHLVSMNLKDRDNNQGSVFSKYDSAFSFKNTTFQKLIHYDSLHITQVQQLDKLISKSTYPVILSGDLNSPPTSYVYHLLKGNKCDVFIEKGCGLGTTYSLMSPTLRIDYILTDPKFKINQWLTPPLYLSDHFPVIADLKID